MSTIPGLVTPAVSAMGIDAHGTMRVTFVICGMTAAFEGHAVTLAPHIERFFDLAERLVTHNIDTANRALRAQESALEIRALAGSGAGTAH